MSYDSISFPEAPWIVYIDKQKNKPYYYHSSTNKTVWNEPEEYSAWKNNAIDIYLKTTTWRRAKNDKGKVYYFDKTTNKTQWEEPEVITQFTQYLPILTQKQLTSKKSKKTEEATHSSQSASSSTVDNSKNIKSDTKPFESSTQEAYDDDEEEDINEDAENDYADDDEFEGTPDQNGDDDEDDLYDDNPMDDLEDTNTYQDSNQNSMLQYNSMGSFGDVETSASSTVNNEVEINRLLTILSKRDSILEPNAVNDTKRLRTLTNEDPMTTVKRLVDNYVGYPAMNNILSEWLTVAKLLNSDANAFKVSPAIPQKNAIEEFIRKHKEKEQEVENIVVQELASLIKQKFDRSAADNIILQVSDIPKWLLSMMNSKIMRKTLIELYNLNSDSTLLGFVLRQLSKLGFHNEIAHLIQEFEYLEVLNDIIVDVVSRLSVANSIEDEDKILSDVKKNYVGNEYLYLYTMEAFFHLEIKLRENSRPSKYIALANKLHRIIQELQDLQIYSQLPSASTTTSSSVLLTKPVLSLRLVGKSSLLYRLDMDLYGQNDSQHHSSRKQSEVIDTFLDLLSSNSLSERQLDSISEIFGLNQPTTLDDVDVVVTRLNTYRDYVPLLMHHQITRLLTKAFIHPRSTQNPSKLAQLLALTSYGQKSSSEPIDWKIFTCGYIATTKKLLASRESCREVIVKGLDFKDYELSEELSKNVRSDPVNAFIVMNWIDYCNSSDVGATEGTNNAAVDLSFSSYVSLVPLFYHLIVQSIAPHFESKDNERLYQHTFCFNVLRNILSKLLNSNTASFESEFIENTNDIVQRLVRDGYECLIYFMGLGFSIIPMQYIVDTVDSMDANIVRFVLTTLLSSTKQPMSMSFLDKFIAFLDMPAILKELSKKEIFSKLLEFETEANRSSIESLLGDESVECSRRAELSKKLNSIVSKSKSGYKY